MLINPWFLNSGDAKDNPIEFQKEAEAERSIKEIPIQSDLAKFLKQKQIAKDQALEIAEEVAKFIGDHKNKFNKISNSQWGAIRALCKTKTDQNICQKVDDFISKGVMAERWNDGKERLLGAIAKSRDPLKFALLLSMQMPKIKGEK